MYPWTDIDSGTNQPANAPTAVELYINRNILEGLVVVAIEKKVPVVPTVSRTMRSVVFNRPAKSVVIGLPDRRNRRNVPGS